MDDMIQACLEKAQHAMDKVYVHVQAAFAKVRAGRALPSMLDGLMVMYYGNETPIGQVASISAPDARTLAIKPWEARLIPELEKAIFHSRLALTPQNDGETIRLNIPLLTEERRQGLVKQIRAEAEKGKEAVRNARKEAKEALKHLQKTGTSEDEVKTAEGKVQELTDTYIKQIDTLLSRKEAEIMTV